VVVPVAFVSEHSETLVELDIQYAKVAKDSGVPAYLRVPALGVEENFINCLASLVEAARTTEGKLKPETEPRHCPENCGKCAAGLSL